MIYEEPYEAGRRAVHEGYETIWDSGCAAACLYDSGQPAFRRFLSGTPVYRPALSGLWDYQGSSIFNDVQVAAGMADEPGYFPGCGGSALFCH